MPIYVPADQVETAASALLGGIDVDGGPTPQQVGVLRAIVANLWERPDLDLDAMKPIDPMRASRLITDPFTRRRVNQVLVILELTRHPQTAAQIERVEEFAHAMEIYGPDLEIVRRWADEGAERATEDYDRFYEDRLAELSEPGLRETHLHIDNPDTELAEQLQALHDLPEDTLGYAYIEFYRRNNLVLPGADTHTPAHYVSHDMNHVIAGYEPTGPGEIALGAFTVTMNDNEANWMQFMTNLLIHEAGMLKHGAIMPKAETLGREGATELLGEALARGAQTTGDFSQADHLTMAAWPLADVRGHYNVVPLAIPMY